MSRVSWIATLKVVLFRSWTCNFLSPLSHVPPLILPTHWELSFRYSLLFTCLYPFPHSIIPLPVLYVFNYLLFQKVRTLLNLPKNYVILLFLVSSLSYCSKYYSTYYLIKYDSVTLLSLPLSSLLNARFHRGVHNICACIWRHIHAYKAYYICFSDCLVTFPLANISN